jgi:uncharacterized protein with beta-barrel porin domain
MNATDVRSKLGVRFDSPEMIGGMLLRARLGWAHDWVNNPSLSAAFESLRGPASPSMARRCRRTPRLPPPAPNSPSPRGLTLIAKFDGEFARGSQTYGGSVTLRYAW